MTRCTFAASVVGSFHQQQPDLINIASKDIRAMYNEIQVELPIDILIYVLIQILITQMKFQEIRFVLARMA